MSRTVANTPSLVNRMPPKNARVARPAAANLRATRRVTRSASQASSEAESRRGGAPENENPVEMPNVANAALLAELQRYRDAYGGHLPNGEAAADAGDNPIPPRAAQNPPPPPPPPAAPAVVHAPGPNYWDMLRHMKSMQTEFFNGKADAIVIIGDVNSRGTSLLQGAHRSSVGTWLLTTLKTTH